MAGVPSSLPLAITVSLLFLSIFTPSLSDVPPWVPVAPGGACSCTPYPSFCKSILPPRGQTNLYNYGRFSVAQSLWNARRFLKMVNLHLARRSSLSASAVGALEDCRLLLALNVDFLRSAGATLKHGTSLPNPTADQVQTFLSALLTNQQTCLDGLQATASAWSVKNVLAAPLSTGTKMYSVSLALVTRAWIPGKRRGPLFGRFVRDRLPRMKSGRWPHEMITRRNLLFHEVQVGQDGSLPLQMSDRNRQLFESKSGRKLLQSSSSTSGQILVSDIVVVSQHRTGDFTTIAAAISSAPNNTGVNNGYYLIYVVAGLYQEYIVVPGNKRYLMIIGDGINQTVITGNHSMGDGWTTFNSATMAVVGQGFVAVNVTIRNTAGAIKGQAVAVRNGADLSTFYSCSFEGYQDTLYTHSLRQFYRECDIYGTVDFIFGNAAVEFQNCNIYPRLPILGQSNAITAQGRMDPNQNTGTSIQGCTFRPSAELAASGGSTRTYLGRPWKLYSRTVVMESFMDKFINPAGWLPWNGTFALDTLYYAEYNNTGPGSNTSKRVTWPGYHVINATDAANFTVVNFLLGDNWLPQSGVPYYSGLL